MSQSRRFSKGERALIALGILVPTIALAGVGMDRKLNTVPEFVPPPQTIPAPNALDTLRHAYTLRTLKWPNSKGPKARFEDTLKLPLAERQAYVAANAKTIARIREALGQSYATPIDWRDPMNAMFPQYAEHREQARLLYIASRTHADAGELSEATRCALDAVALGVLVGSDGPLIGYLVGNACESIGHKALWELVDRLDAATATQVLVRLDTIEKRRVPLAKAYAIERGFSQKMISDLAHRKISTAAMAGMMTDGGDKEAQGKLAIALALTDKGAAWEANRKYFDALEAQLSRPYMRGESPVVPTDAVNRIILPVLGHVQFTLARNQTDMALLRGYLMQRQEKRTSELPQDPFGQNQPLRYEKTPTGYRLWSVGPDGKDDGGKPIALQKKETRVYDATQSGDVVARINTF
jgi:hypothetical protein